VYVEDGKAFTHSAAPLRVAAALFQGSPAGLMAWLAVMVAPRMLRDELYMVVSRNRYAWFGDVQDGDRVCRMRDWDEMEGRILE